MARLGSRRRTFALVLAVATVGGAVTVSVVPAAAVPGAEPPEWLEDLEPSAPDDDPVSPPIEEYERPPAPQNGAGEPLEATMPEPGASLVTLTENQEVVDDVVGLAAAEADVEGTALEVEVLDQDVAEQAGVSGFVFTVSAEGSGGESTSMSEAGGDNGLPVDISIDYSEFAHAFGGGYADRLQVVALPACALEAPRPEGCRVEGVELPSTNNAETQQLLVDAADLSTLVSSTSGLGLVAQPALAEELTSMVDGEGLAEAVAPAEDGPASADAEPAAGGAVTLAVTAAASGSGGNYGATPLSTSADWQVGLGSGEFSWSYPMTIPTPPAGQAPSVGLGYSSAAIDGIVSTRNTQAPAQGVGWSDFASAFIERRYEGCEGDMNYLVHDFCWKSDNATISLNGRAGELIPTNAQGTEWRLKSDPGWVVQRLTGIANNDNDGEHWKVITPDGTEYWFGLNTRPETGEVTDSVWTVPVYGTEVGDPCLGPTGNWNFCQQAWRWNLDRVVDPNGLTTTYFYGKGTNHYLTAGGYGGLSVPYNNDGALFSIEYGKPAGSGPAVAAAGRVVFGIRSRCSDLNDLCDWPNPNNGAWFPDVPNDLLCSGGCVVTRPSFFQKYRYAFVRTEVRTGGQWKTVEQHNLYHAFKANSDGDQKLYLTEIERVGGTGATAINLPRISFLATEMPNRADVDLAAGKKPMGHFRTTAIVDEFGKLTLVTYGQPRGCPASYAGPFESNTLDCIPQKVLTGVVNGDRVWGNAIFHKYVTTRVEERDPVAGGPAVITDYTYVGNPAWHHDDDEFNAAGAQTWSDWRGYGEVVMTQGASKTRSRVFRGMHNDRLPNHNRRTASVSAFDGTPFVDEPWLAGAVLEQQQLGPFGPTPETALETTLTEYEARINFQPGNDPLDWVVWVAPSRITSGEATAVGQFERTRATTTYNARFQPETVFYEGSLGQTGDERCSRTTYAENPPRGMFSYPASTVTVAGNCTSTTELSRNETYYDGTTTLGAAPVRGNPTMERVKIDATTFVTTAQTTYDSVGRPLTVTDASGAVTETVYAATPNGGFPASSSVTQRAGTSSFTTTTTWLADYGVPLTVTDPNNKVTTYTYDSLGRLRTVRLPTEATTSKPSWEFAYVVDAQRDGVSMVRTIQNQSNDSTRVIDSWVVYDAFLRERQSQALSPESGKIVVTDTAYDNRGFVRQRSGPQASTAAPGTLASVTWDNHTEYSYDSLGRPTQEAYFRGTQQRFAVTTSYTHNTTTVVQPDDRRTRTTDDSLGRTAKIEEWDGTNWVGTSYGYDLADQLTSVTDPAGNTITHTYNMAGWRLSTDDPDSGAWSFGYDVMGRQTKVTDANGAVTFTGYDPIGRPSERRQGGPTGTVLATWTYDAAGEKGMLDRSTRVTPQGNWVDDITGYDGRYRPLGRTLTVPAGLPGLTGSYTVGFGYNRADQVTSASYPAVGGLAAETVTTAYSTTGLPESTIGLEDYVWSAAYDNRGRPTALGLGPHTGSTAWLGRSFSYDADQRIASMEAATTSGVVVDHDFGYDAVGILKERTTRLGSESRRECYTYDTRMRLTASFTTTLSATCANGTPGTGDRPYQSTYQYSPDGNMTQRVEGGVTDSYTYPTGAGVDRPHAPTAVGGDTFVWDANGNLTSRTIDGVTETLAWDAERRLSSVTGPDGVDSFVYGVGGDRLLRTTPQGRTLFFEGHELFANLDGTGKRATRSYGFGGTLVATRTSDGVDYLVTDQQGSVEAALPSGGTLQTARTYAPYGRRTSGGQFDTDKGWIGQVEDDSTALSYLNARYYDPTAGVFISPDPLLDLARPKSLNPYAYAHGNPIGNSDPSGLWTPINAHDPTAGGYNSNWTPATNLSEVQRARRVHQRSHTSTPAWLDEVAARREAHRQAMMWEGLAAMCSLNCDPAFWEWGAAIGGAQGLANWLFWQDLGQLQAINSDPSYWADVAVVTRPDALSAWANELAAIYGGRTWSSWPRLPQAWPENAGPTPTGSSGGPTAGRRVPPSMRSEILAGNPRCIYCGDPATEVDHYIPRSQGGNLEPENLGAACRTCNASKSARLPGVLGVIGFLSIIISADDQIRLAETCGFAALTGGCEEILFWEACEASYAAENAAGNGECYA